MARAIWLSCLGVLCSVALAADRPDPIRLIGTFTNESDFAPPTLKLNEDGSFSLKFKTMPERSDVFVSCEATGEYSVADRRLLVDVSKIKGDGGLCRAVASDFLSHRHIVTLGDATYLVSDEGAIGLVNAINASGNKSRRSDVNAWFLHDKKAIAASDLSFLPKSFQHLVLATPLKGQLTELRDVQTHRSESWRWPLPSTWSTIYTGTGVIDLGSEHGVFLGMVLQVGSWEAKVVRLFSRSAEVSMLWRETLERPSVGDVARSDWKSNP